MPYKLLAYTNNQKKDITSMIGSLSWSSNIDTLGIELNFDYAYNDNLYFKDLDILDLGGHILLTGDDEELHRFVIVSQEQNGRFGKKYTCFDYAWYLNKNEAVIQFNRLNASEAIKRLLDRFNIKHSITKINTLISKIYRDETLSEIIKDILVQATQETGIKYRVEMRLDTLHIEKQSDLIINPMVQIGNNNILIPVGAAIGNLSKKTSIEELKNKVVVISDEEQSMSILANMQDDNSILKYGSLQEIIVVDKKNEAQSRNIAKNSLNELNRIQEDINVELLGHKDIRAGRIIKINEPVTGIIGSYLIKAANHNINNGIHKVNVALGAAI